MTDRASIQTKCQDSSAMDTSALPVCESASKPSTVIGSCYQGRAALADIERLRPNVAILDLRMPEMSGLEAACAMADVGLDIPVVILSAFDDPQLQVEAERAGVVTAYLVKGGASTEIFDTLWSIFHRRDA
jgi:DNA-binding NarL/FixJ family response regulator